MSRSPSAFHALSGDSRAAVAPIVVHVALNSSRFQQTAAMSLAQDNVPRALRRAIWYLRCVAGFALIFAGLWGIYGVWGAWALLISPVSIIAGGLIVPGVAERLPRRW